MKQWKLRETDCKTRQELCRQLGISETLSRILINRGITDAKTAHNFLHGTLADLHPWQQLPDIQKAKPRIQKAISQKEKILIYGDYDVDGVTACVLLYDVLSKMGADVIYYIPDRIEEGYGLNTSVFPVVKKNNVSLIITVDCGISAFEEVEFFNKNSIEVIITDHHKIRTDALPPAFAVVCPQRTDSEYPFKELSGVGVVFKLAQALIGDEQAFEYLDLVALGTVADVVPLVDENRILVKEGLKRISTTSRKGLSALVEKSGLGLKDICARDVGYILGPRLNASGRLGSADSAVKLLTTNDDEEAKFITDELNKSNRQRQKLQEQILSQALAKVEREINFKEHKVIVLEDESWHPGLIGIVASRISQEFYRPAIIISTKDSPAKGSGRSIKNFHLFDAVNDCRHLLVDYGGHAFACGISITKDKIKSFGDSINNIAHNVLKSEDLIPTLEIDAEITLTEVDSGFIEGIERLAPFGCGNPQPIFLSRGVSFKNKPAYFGKNNVKGWVTDGKNICEAVGFGMAQGFNALQGGNFDLVYYPYLNQWGGIETISLSLKDAKISTQY